jgi:uncharacterized damage-inducible protein DinB
MAAATDNTFESVTRAALLRSLDDASGKILRLADAIPEGRYGWRPMEGVMSVREVLIHLAETNYSLSKRLGTPTPAGIDGRKLDAVADSKTAAIAVFKRSYEFVRGVLAAVPADDLLPEVNLFGAKAPQLRVALLPVDHAHEHLGQLIAYARMNRIVPPWSK